MDHQVFDGAIRFLGAGVVSLLISTGFVMALYSFRGASLFWAIKKVPFPAKVVTGAVCVDLAAGGFVAFGWWLLGLSDPSPSLVFGGWLFLVLLAGFVLGSLAASAKGTFGPLAKVWARWGKLNNRF